MEDKEQTLYRFTNSYDEIEIFRKLKEIKRLTNKLSLKEQILNSMITFYDKDTNTTNIKAIATINRFINSLKNNINTLNKTIESFKEGDVRAYLRLDYFKASTKKYFKSLKEICSYVRREAGS